MPTYCYRCLKCKKEFEFLHLGKEVAECPKCGSTDLKKLPSSFGGISEDTRFETNSGDLPSMHEFTQKRSKPIKKLNRDKILGR